MLWYEGLGGCMNKQTQAVARCCAHLGECWALSHRARVIIELLSAPKAACRAPSIASEAVPARSGRVGGAIEAAVPQLWAGGGGRGAATAVMPRFG